MNGITNRPERVSGYRNKAKGLGIKSPSQVSEQYTPEQFRTYKQHVDKTYSPDRGKSGGLDERLPIRKAMGFDSPASS